MNDTTLKSLLVTISFFVIAAVGVALGIIITSNRSVTDSSAYNNKTITCYKCTESEADLNACEAFSYSGEICPSGSSASSTLCSVAVGGKCPAVSFSNISDTTDTQTSLTCYKCSASTSDGNLCESFIYEGENCPAGTSSSSTGCKSAAGGFCPQAITCYRCTSSTLDGNTCEVFVSETAECPSGSSTTSTGCATAIGGQCATNTTVCGLIDINNDGILNVIDLAGFQQLYGRFCSDTPISYPVGNCGPKDTNNDGKIDVIDLNSFNARYLAPSCII